MLNCAGSNGVSGVNMSVIDSTGANQPVNITTTGIGGFSISINPSTYFISLHAGGGYDVIKSLNDVGDITIITSLLET